MGSTAEDIKKDPLGSAVNFVTNFQTYGVLGYEDGKIKAGAVTEAADESLGEITGRNMARDQQAIANAKIDAEAAQRERERLEQQQQDEINDRNASMQAQGLRNTGYSRSASQNGNTLGAPLERDFLGL